MKAFEELTPEELNAIRLRRIEIETYYCTKCLNNDIPKMVERLKKAIRDYKLYSDPYEKFYLIVEAETINKLILKLLEEKE